VAGTWRGARADQGLFVKFFKLVRPSGPGWKPIEKLAGVGGSLDNMPQALLGWMLGCAFVYAALFGTGSLLYGRMPQFWLWFATFLLSGFGMFRVLRGFWATKT